MKTINVASATGPALDWAVAKCEGVEITFSKGAGVTPSGMPSGQWEMYSTSWAQGGPIIEREGITLRCGLHGWDAELEEFDAISHGPTTLIAAMRCYVASKLGYTVEVPEELV